MTASSSSTYLLPALENAPGAPAFLLQVTDLGPASTLLWVGTSSAHQPQPTAGRRLAGEWVCGMPSASKGRPAVGTTLYRASSPTDLALPISLRLARKLGRQILLSLALPPSLTATSQALGADTNQGRILVNLEGQILRTLRDREAGEQVASLGDKEAEGVSEATGALEASTLLSDGDGGGEMARLVGR